MNLRERGNIFKYVSITFIFAFLGCMCIRLDIERISVILYILYGIIIPIKWEISVSGKAPDATEDAQVPASHATVFLS